jgi:hypothetical protein
MPRTALKKSSSNDDEVLWGAEAIGAAINRTPMQVYYLIQQKKKTGFPVDRLGHRLIRSTRSRLRAWVAGENL